MLSEIVMRKAKAESQSSWRESNVGEDIEAKANVENRRKWKRICLLTCLCLPAHYCLHYWRERNSERKALSNLLYLIVASVKRERSWEEMKPVKKWRMPSSPTQYHVEEAEKVIRESNRKKEKKSSKRKSENVYMKNDSEKLFRK